MPLQNIGDETYAAAMEGVNFAMNDTVTGQRVTCSVSREALQDRAALEGRKDADLEYLFLSYRAEVERIASSLYDAGHAHPRVTSNLLAPRL